MTTRSPLLVRHPFRSVAFEAASIRHRVTDSLAGGSGCGCVRRTPSYVMGALKKEVMEKVPWIAPAAGTLYGCVWYAQDFKRKEDLHHRF
jgi:hypothetical protein